MNSTNKNMKILLRIFELALPFWTLVVDLIYILQTKGSKLFIYYIYHYLFVKLINILQILLEFYDYNIFNNILFFIITLNYVLNKNIYTGIHLYR